jgi:hypothetical protein
LREEADTWIWWCGVSEVVVLEEVVHDLLGLPLAASYDGVQAKHKPLLVSAFSLASMAAVVIAWGSTVIKNKIPRANCRCYYYYCFYYCYYCTAATATTAKK